MFWPNEDAKDQSRQEAHSLLEDFKHAENLPYKDQNDKNGNHNKAHFNPKEPRSFVSIFNGEHFNLSNK